MNAYPKTLSLMTALIMLASLQAIAQPQADSVLFRAWDFTAQQWNNSSLNLHSYDANCYLQTTQIKLWDVNTQQWNLLAQTTHSYNSMQQLYQQYSQNWTGSSFVNILRITYYYTSTGKIDFNIFEFWNSTLNQWENNMRNSFTYDANDFLISSLTETWNNNAQAWENASRRTFTNNSSGQPVSLLYEQWQATGNQWENHLLVTNTYDTQGLLTESLTRLWNSSSLQWENSSVNYLTYDASGYMINFLQQTWDALSNSWINSLKSDYQNNPNGSIAYYLNQTWNQTSSIWENNSDGTYHYACTLLSSMPETSSASSSHDLMLYPVPARDVITLSFENFKREAAIKQIEITDMQGRSVDKTDFNTSGYLMHYNISHLSSGSYLLRITDSGHKTHLVKFLKQ